MNITSFILSLLLIPITTGPAQNLDPEACLVTVTYKAENRTATMCEQNLALPSADFETLCNRYMGMEKRDESGQTSVAIEMVSACPADFSATCLASTKGDDPRPNKSFYYGKEVIEKGGAEKACTMDLPFPGRKPGIWELASK